IGKRIVRLFQKIAAIHQKSNVFQIGGDAMLKNFIGKRAAKVPYLRPYFVSTAPERPWMLGRTQYLDVGIIVKKSNFGPPPDPHGMLGVQNQINGSPETLGPVFNWTKRSCGPIVIQHQFA